MPEKTNAIKTESLLRVIADFDTPGIWMFAALVPLPQEVEKRPRVIKPESSSTFDFAKTFFRVISNIMSWFFFTTVFQLERTYRRKLTNVSNLSHLIWQIDFHQEKRMNFKIPILNKKTRSSECLLFVGLRRIKL